MNKFHAILILAAVLVINSSVYADTSSLVQVVNNDTVEHSSNSDKDRVWIESQIDSRLTVMLQFFNNLTLDPNQDKIGYTLTRDWIVDRMLTWVKPGKSFYPLASETLEEGQARYTSIAESVLLTIAREKSIFPGRTGRIKTAALMLSIAMFESGFRKDVDLNLGKSGRGDGGRSWCMMQIQLGSEIFVDENGKILRGLKPGKDKAPEGSHVSTPMHVVLKDDGGLEFTGDQTRGLSGQDLIEHRDACFTVGLRVIRSSFASCRELPLLERLSLYASGNCEDGKDASKNRVGAAIAWVTSKPPPVSDAKLIASMHKLSLQ